MKKISVKLFLLIWIFCGMQLVKAETFEDYMALSKPCAILLYADWADNLQEVKTSYTAMKKIFDGRYNFAAINISKEEAKEYNKKYDIYPNLPYLILFKERGKFSRYIQRDCLIDEACVKTKMDLFAN